MKYPKEYLDEIKLRLKVSIVGKLFNKKKREKVHCLSPLKVKNSFFTVNGVMNFIIVLALASTAIFLIF